MRLSVKERGLRCVHRAIVSVSVGCRSGLPLACACARSLAVGSARSFAPVAVRVPSLARVCVCVRRICVYMRVLSCCDLDFERSAKRISESFAKEKLFIVRRVEHSLRRRCQVLKIDFTASFTFTGKIGTKKMLSIVCRAVSTLPAPRQCDSWAKSGECERNPGFMWAECADACKALGLKEPWADADEQASNGLPPSTRAQTLELRFPHDSGFAPLRILLRPDLAPKTVAALVQHIGEAGGTPAAATFYRNEAVPAESPGQCGDILCGPYSLIQGRLDALLDTPSETTPLVRKGFVARIQNGHDFFIALDDHSEWGHSFTVWGDMRHDATGMATLDAISRLPYHEQKAAGASTIMRLLDVELEARAAIVEGRPAGAQRGDQEGRTGSSNGAGGSGAGGGGGGGGSASGTGSSSSSSSSAATHVEEMEL